MIRYIKINDTLAEILYEGNRIGYLRKTIGGYDLELLYTSVFVKDCHANKLTNILPKLYKSIVGFSLNTINTESIDEHFKDIAKQSIPQQQRLYLD